MQGRKKALMHRSKYVWLESCKNDSRRKRKGEVNSEATKKSIFKRRQA